MHVDTQDPDRHTMKSTGEASGKLEHRSRYREQGRATPSRALRSAISRQFSWWLVVGDAVSLVAAWAMAVALLRLVGPTAWWEGVIAWWSAEGEGRAALFSVLLALMLILFAARGHYSRRRPVADEVLDIIKVLLVVAIVDLVVAYLSKAHFSRAWFISAWCLALITLPLGRILTKRLLLRLGRWQRPTVILGTGQNAQEAAKALCSEPLMGLEIVAFLLPKGEVLDARALEVAGRQVEVVAAGEDLEGMLERLDRPHLMVALEADSLLAHQGVLQKLSARNLDLNVFPPLRGLPLYGMEMTHFFSHEVLMLTARNNLVRPVPRLVKRLLDVVGSLSLLVVLAPLFAYLCWEIRRSGVAPIFGHLRVGRHGKEFRCLKFRTMVPDADDVLKKLLDSDPSARAEWDRDFKLKDDPRITSVGLFLRKTSLDELPQLWNVLKGEMSLVGPRPIVEEELERYGDQVDYYLKIRPGITGLWQISGRSNTGYEDRVALDGWYVRNWSLWYDLVILVKTVYVVLRGEGAY
jgi:undecaprenyl-phosphate galactose phosphotransferase